MSSDSPDSEASLREAIDRYNAAWNAHDLAPCLAANGQKWRPQIGDTRVCDWRAPDQAGQGRREAE